MRGPRGLPPHPRRRSSRRGRRFCATCVRGLHLRRLLGEGVKQMFHVKHTPTGYPPAVSRPSGSTRRPPPRTGPTARAGSTARTGPAARTGPTARAGPAPPPGGSCRVLVGRPPVFWAALQIQSVLHPAFTAVHAFFLWPTRKRPGRKCLASLCRGAATLRGVQNRPNLQCSSVF